MKKQETKPRNFPLYIVLEDGTSMGFETINGKEVFFGDENRIEEGVERMKEAIKQIKDKISISTKS